MASSTDLSVIAAKRGIGEYKCHVFFCTGAKCANAEASQAAWDRLKADLAVIDTDRVCYRTKVGCLRICADGPIAVVYPEGYWLKGVVESRIPDLVHYALTGDATRIKDLVFAKNEL